MLPFTSYGLPWSQTRRTASSPLFDLSSGGVCPAGNVTISAVSSYLTISPLPINRRYIFCGTFPKIALGGRYPPPCPMMSGLSSVKIFTAIVFFTLAPKTQKFL